MAFKGFAKTENAGEGNVRLPGLIMFLFWLFSMLRKSWKAALLSGIAVAWVDETIQAFVPDRAPRLLDVGIDSMGVLTGMILLMLGHTYWKRRSAR